MSPLLRVFPPYSGQNSVMSCDILSSSHVGELGGNKIKCKKDILVAGDHEDVSDIVEKFIKVAHGPTGLENNRARENARENIRKKLALEAGREKMDGCDLQVTTENINIVQCLPSSLSLNRTSNAAMRIKAVFFIFVKLELFFLQICFVNEFASDEEAAEDRAEFPVLAKEEIVKSNISKRVSQIIVPLSSVREAETGSHQDPSQDTEPSSVFRTSVSQLQTRARQDLLEARERASTRMLDIVNTRRKYHNNNILRLLGLSVESKVRI